MTRLALLALAVALTGCGGAREHGTATLWVTRDRGEHVVFTGTVPAGLTAMQALERKLDVDTRYGGRFVQAIDGVAGSASRQRDWFYFVNGIEGDRSAAEVRLRPGDVEWWDYRHWTARTMSIPVVVGAFPEPFLHGFGSIHPGGCVSTARAADDSVARRLVTLINPPTAPPTVGCASANEMVIEPAVSPTTFRAERSGRGVRFVVGEEAARRLARNPGAFRYRYEVRP